MLRGGGDEHCGNWRQWKWEHRGGKKDLWKNIGKRFFKNKKKILYLFIIREF